MLAGKKVELIRKDVGGINPPIAKRLAQELVTRDNVDLLVGFQLTPNALAAADVSAEAKKFMVVMNAAPPSSPPSRRIWRASHSPSPSSTKRLRPGRKNTG